MEQTSVNRETAQTYQILMDFDKPVRITDIAAVRLALIEFKREGGFNTIDLTRRSREIAGRFITDGSVTRLARMHRFEFPFICVHRGKAQYEFLEPRPVPAVVYSLPGEQVIVPEGDFENKGGEDGV